MLLSGLLSAQAGYCQTVTTFAGNSAPGFNGDEKTALATQLWAPGGLALSGGNLFFADGLNNRLRKVSPGGIVTTLTGDDNPGNSGDNGPATDARLNYPEGMTIDGHGNIYIADKYNNSIRKITPAGIITRFAGSGQSGFSGDGALASSAQLNGPCALAVDIAGNVYITDAGNNCIRRVTPEGIMSTVAGTGREGYRCDSCSATTAQLNAPRGITTDTAGNLYIADALNYRIRKVTPSGLITTLAGNGESGFSGDGEAATAARLNMPTGVAIDKAGNIYIADQSNNRIRVVTPEGIISTAAGGGIDSTNQLSAPTYLTADGNGILYVSEQQDNLIKKVIPPPPAPKVVKNRSKAAATNSKPYVAPPFATPNMNTPPPSYRASFQPPSSPPPSSGKGNKGR